MKRIGIFGGSFDPVHTGHVSLARNILANSGLDEVWMMPTPLNPLKKSKGYCASDQDRLEMLRLACRDTEGLVASDYEYSRPKPAYTADTLDALSLDYPDCNFSLIIGSDNWAIFDKWRNYTHIIDHFEVIVYTRPGYLDKSVGLKNVRSVESTLYDISSTEIRLMLLNRDAGVNKYLHPEVYNYIKTNNLYVNPR